MDLGYGPRRDLRARGEAQFDENMFDVPLRGSRRTDQAIGDCLVGQAFCDEVGDLAFARGEALGRTIGRRGGSGWFAERESDCGIETQQTYPLVLSPTRRIQNSEIT